MTVLRHGVGTLPDNPPKVTLEWNPALGESKTVEWEFDRELSLAKYEELKEAENLRGLRHVSSNGRGQVIAEFGRTGNSHDPDTGYNDDITVIEELYAVDVVKDIESSPYFSIALDAGHALYSTQNAGVKGLPLTDWEVSIVRDITKQNLGSDNDFATYTAGKDWDGYEDLVDWTIGMLELKYHLSHGVESYNETGYILRRSKYGVRKSAIRQAFTGINTVLGSTPTFQSPMDDLLQTTLPGGEWLIRPPQCEHLGKGRWRVSEEWWWAEQWSVMYKGTWNYTP